VKAEERYKIGIETLLRERAPQLSDCTSIEVSYLARDDKFVCVRIAMTIEPTKTKPKGLLYSATAELVMTGIAIMPRSRSFEGIDLVVDQDHELAITGYSKLPVHTIQ
jgi:hypothetical protein